MLPTDVAVHQGLWHHRSSSFESLRSSILDSSNFLHHKNCRERLFIEVDASDAGWGACAYQMVHPWLGHPDEEGRGRQGDTGPGRSYNGPAKRGLLLSLSSLSFIGSRCPGYWRWRDIGISLKPTSRQESHCTLITSLDCTRIA